MSRGDGFRTEHLFDLIMNDLGVRCSKPVKEISYDRVCDLENNLSRIQIRSSDSLCEDGHYHVSLRKQENGEKVTYTKAHADFMVVHVAPLHDWYPMPISAVEDLTNMSFADNPVRPGKYEKYRNNWEGFLELLRMPKA